jgi:hypothetical protein
MVGHCGVGNADRDKYARPWPRPLDRFVETEGLLAKAFVNCCARVFNVLASAALSDICFAGCIFCKKLRKSSSSIVSNWNLPGVSFNLPSTGSGTRVSKVSWPKVVLKEVSMLVVIPGSAAQAQERFRTLSALYVGSPMGDVRTKSEVSA